MQSNTTGIETEKNARIAGDRAEAEARETLTAQVNQNKAAIERVENLAVENNNIAATGRRTLQVQIDYNSDSTIRNALNVAEAFFRGAQCTGTIRLYLT